MLQLYNIGITLYFWLLCLAAPVNIKAKLWLAGRRHMIIKPLTASIWFHFASLGEFEQGRPVLEKIKALYPDQPVVITFFSPSGYEVCKNTPLADAVYYLPLDKALIAREFISTINPVMAIFTKYEYWYHYFNELHTRHVPLYIISGIFRPGQVFFKWYGGLHRKMLKMVTWFFVQDIDSKHLLHDAGITHVSISGDTRFDRVWANTLHPAQISMMDKFKNNQRLFIAGSTWPQDEVLLADLVKQHPGWKFIIAPHEIKDDKINRLLNELPEGEAIKYSKLTAAQGAPLNCRVLVVDNIGMLSSLYQYADIAYIGGGFGAGIHNTLEAAAFGLPLIFGPNFSKFKEARDMIGLKAGFAISNKEQLKSITAELMINKTFRSNAGQQAKEYVQQNIGATDTIINYIKERH